MQIQNYKIKQTAIISIFICVLTLPFQNCSQVDFALNYNTLASLASSGPMLIVNGGRPSNSKIMPVAFQLAALQSQTGAEFTSMRLGLNRNTLDSAPYVPFANPTSIDLQTEYANDGTKDGIKNIYVDIHIKGTEAAMNLIGQLTLDTIAPTTQSLNIENGASSTTMNYTSLQLQAHDTYSNITQVCFKTFAIQPSVKDLCWTPVSQLGANALSPNLDLKKAPFLIGFVQGKYTVYAFLQDEAGNISKLTSAGAGTDKLDRKSIQYNPPIPPVLINIFASNTDHSSFPPKLNQLTNMPGDSIYIKWKVASAPGGLGANPVQLFYTLDEKHYSLIESNLANAANGDCSLDANYSGCYKWTSKIDTDKYFRIRVGVQDKNGQLSFASTLPINTGSFYILAGNTDPGLDGSAASAIFYNANLSQTFYADPQSFVITQFGSIVFRDSQRGLLLIDPYNGIQKLIVPLDVNGGGHFVDGPLGTATLAFNNARIALDYNDRILIMDSSKIRVLDLQSKTLTSFIGNDSRSSGSLASGTLANKFDFSINDSGGSNTVLANPMYPLPNGDLIFKNGSDRSSIGAGASLRIYKASDQRIYTMNPSGAGANYGGSWDPSWDITSSNHTLNNFGIGFDPFNSQLTNIFAGLYMQIVGDNAYYFSSLDPYTFKVLPQNLQMAIPFGFGHNTDQYLSDRVGNTTSFSRWGAKILQFNNSNNSWTTVLGTGTLGQCADGTKALDCNVDLQSVFIGPQNQIYFADRGRIRTIADGKVFSIIGQSYSFGDGGLATSARFGLVDYIDQDKNNNIVVLDSTEARFRSFPAAGAISTIAGNGTAGNPDDSQLAVNQPLLTGYWGGLYSFTIDQNTGDLYFVNYKLNATTGHWQNLYGSATNFANGDGLPAASITANYPWATLGFGGGKLLQASNNWTYDATHPNGWLYDSFYKLYDSTNNYVQSNLAGSHEPSTSGFGADGDPLSNAQVPPQFNQENSKVFYDKDKSRWYALNNRSSAIKILKEGPDEVMQTLVNLPRAISSFTYVLNSSSQPMVYYCATDGLIYKFNITLKTEKAIPWPSPSIACQGNALLLNPSRNSVIFPFSQNALNGVAEVVDTP